MVWNNSRVLLVSKQVFVGEPLSPWLLPGQVIRWFCSSAWSGPCTVQLYWNTKTRWYWCFLHVWKCSGHVKTNNKPSSTVIKHLFVASSATKQPQEGALWSMVVERTILRNHIFNQVVLLAVIFDIIIIHVLMSWHLRQMTIWFGLDISWGKVIHVCMSLLQSAKKGIVSQQCQCSITNPGFFLATC